jgi:hypothetical protein
VSDPAFPIVRQTPGWWKVVDRTGDTGFYEFREDGRARMLRGRYWDWCHVKGEWTPVTEPAFLKWANADQKPSAVWGEPGFLKAFESDRSQEAT